MATRSITKKSAASKPEAALVALSAFKAALSLLRDVGCNPADARALVTSTWEHAS